MRKIYLIGLKDLTLAFRDRAALVLMLLAPFALTLGLGAVTGRFSGGGTGLSRIPVVVVNADDAALGDALEAALTGAELAELLAPTVLTDAAAARQQVAEDEAAAAVIIPAGFTLSATGQRAEAIPVEVHANPGRVISAGVVQAIVEAFVDRVQLGAVGGAVAGAQLAASGRVTSPAEAAAAAQAVGQALAEADAPGGLRVQRVVAAASEAPRFDVLSVLAPSMALFFLMYTVSHGGRNLLAERTNGTLPRLMVSPTPVTQVLAGKVWGIFLTGFTQVGVLILASAVLFQVRWGDWAGVAALTAAAAFGATGWGLILAALAKTPSQVANIGSALMLVFGLVGGGLANIPQPAWLEAFARLTPNKWGVDGFTVLGTGGTLAEVLPHVAALVAMGLVLFAAATVLFRRQGFLQR